MKYKELTNKIIGCAIEVHKQLGPGLLESTYEQCLVHEFALNNVNAVFQQKQPVEYKGLELDCGYRLDVMVDDKVILELKAVDDLKPIHEAQLMTYMKLVNKSVGLLINFNVTKLINGIKRFVI